jgi:Sec-independent protein secretion pathway component TatC
MEKKTVGILATIVVALLFGISGIILAFVGSIPALVNYMPSMHGAGLSIPSGAVSYFSVLGELQSCCICIPIPLAFGALALHQHVKGRMVEESRSESSDMS